MEKAFRLSLAARLVTAAFLGVCMFIFILFNQPYNLPQMSDTLTVAVCFSLLYTAALVLLGLKFKDDILLFFFVAAALAALIYIRVCLIGYQSTDYTNFLSVWLEQMRGMSPKEVLCEKIGDYNMPYLYFLLLLSRTELNSLILIKFLSCVFDFVTAFFIMKCIEIRTKNSVTLSLSFITAAALPTVFLNSSYWAQCDSVLAAFCIMSVYFAMKSKGICTAVCYALAFSIKLQAVFILPVILICFVTKRLRLWHVALAPAVFFATLLPAIFAGRSLVDCIRIYFDQAAQYPRLTLLAPSIWQFFGSLSFELFNPVGIMLGGIAAITLMFICYKYRHSLDTELLLTAFYISALLIPFLLPRMHERYFYLADVLSVTVFFFNRKKWYLPLVTVFASLNAYMAFLASSPIIDQKLSALALLIILVITIKDFVERIVSNVPQGKTAVG